MKTYKFLWFTGLFILVVLAQSFWGYQTIRAEELSPYALTFEPDSTLLNICMMKEKSRSLNIADPREILIHDGSTEYSYAMYFQARGDYLYAHVPNGLLVYDISDVTAPVLLKSIYMDYVAPFSRIRLHGNYLYVPRYDRMIIMDISDGANPVQIADIYVGRIIWDFEVTDNRMYIGISALSGDPVDLPKFYIYDITDPTAAFVLGKYEPPNGYRDLRFFTISGDYVYGLDYWESHLEVINISDETHPTFVQKLSLYPLHYLCDVVCQDGWLYVGDQSGYIHRYDLADPASPQSIDIIDVRRIISLGIHDSVLYVNGYQDIVAVDITPPGNYDTLSIYDSCTTIGDLTFSDTLMFNPRGRQFTIYNIAHPDNMTELCTYDFDTQEFQNIHVVGDYAYLTSWVGYTTEPNRRGLFTFDVSDPANPSLVHWNPVQIGMTEDVYIHNDLGFVCEVDKSDIYSMADPAAPQLIGHYADEYYPVNNRRDPNSFMMRGSLAYLPHNLGFDIVDFSDPLEPQTVSQLEIDGFVGSPQRVLLDGDYAYVTCSEFDYINFTYRLYLNTIDISDPSHPEIIYGGPLQGSDESTHGVVGYMAKQGNYLYVSDAALGAKVVDISNPPAPDVVATYHPVVLNCRDLAIKRGYLLIAGDFSYEAVDITDPLNPQLVQFLESPVEPWRIGVDTDHLYEAGRYGFNSYLINLPPVPCGDANADGGVNVADADYLINYIFKSGPAPDPIEAADANGDGGVDVADAVYLINFVFKGGPPPVEPCG